MSATIEIEQLRVGMFIHLDLGWWAHPFALSNFALSSPEQIETLRRLGIERVRWSPDKSHVDEPASERWQTLAEAMTPAAAQVAGADGQAELAARERERRRQRLAEQRAAEQLCEKQYAEAGLAWSEAVDHIVGQPQAARQTTEGLTHALLDKMMVDGEMCVRVLNAGLGERGADHALNVAVVALLMGRVFGFGADEMLDLGVGALLHDVGKLELPERVRHADDQFGATETAQYREHVAHGVRQGRRMGLTSGALLVLAEHHEMVDGSGFPLRLNGDRMAAAARIVALVNRYDNLCNPALPVHALTPHEALSLIFAQARSKFDATMLNAFIRMMGVYPPGSVVQLTDERYAVVVSVNSSRPLKPRVRVCDPEVPADEALLLDLDAHPDLGVRRSLKAAQLPSAARDYLSPRPRVVYFFEPALPAANDSAQARAA